MVKVRVKEGRHHRVLSADYDPEVPRGAPGPKAKGRDVIEVTEAELASFGDKFEVLPQPPKAEAESKPKVEAEPKPKPKAKAKARVSKD